MVVGSAGSRSRIRRLDLVGVGQISPFTVIGAFAVGLTARNGRRRDLDARRDVFVRNGITLRTRRGRCVIDGDVESGEATAAG